MAALRVVYSYSHADERMLAELQKHLAMLRRRELITEWWDREIDAGERWRDEIARELDAADLIVLLVSSDYLASDFSYEQEMKRAVERASRGEATVIAVMLRPVDGWDALPVADLQVVPRDARPITMWPNADEAWSDVAAKIRGVVEERVREDLPRELRPDEEELRLGAQVQSGFDAGTDPTTAARVGEVAEALEELIRQPVREDDANFLIVQADPTRNYYTQYLGDKGAVWCEAVSNENLDPENALSDEQMSRLVAFGWSPPQGDNLSNWWYVVDEPSPRDLAWLTVQTLDKVYGVALDSPFDVTKSWQ
jgi:hypothetical protein